MLYAAEVFANRHYSVRRDGRAAIPASPASPARPARPARPAPATLPKSVWRWFRGVIGSPLAGEPFDALLEIVDPTPCAIEPPVSLPRRAAGRRGPGKGVSDD